MSKPVNITEICRVRRSKAEAQANYTRLSPLYDLFGAFEEKYRIQGLQVLNARRGERILEIGFGTGHAILALAEAVGEQGLVYGIDISEGMCSITWHRVRKAGLTQRVKIRCGDAAQLPYKSNVFDGLFLSFTLDLIDTPEIPIVLGECLRVLKRGGRICVVAMSKRGKSGFMTRLYEIFHEMMPTFIDCRPIYAAKSLKNAGFKITEHRDISIWGLGGEIVLAQKPR